MEKEGLKCLFCGGDLCYESDGMANEVFAEYLDDDTAVISYYHCLNCGRSYEICEPNKEERQGDYKNYWENGN